MEFQSPSGDSLFSDKERTFCISLRLVNGEKFQSPSGDSLFSDPQILWVTDGR